MELQDTGEKPLIEMTKLKKTVAVRVVVVFVGLGIVLFLPAGTLRFWQAWVYMSVLFIPMLMVMVWLFRNDPAFLERRMRTREKGRRQRNIQLLGLPFYLGIYLIPGLDKRFGWSSVPQTVVLIADLLVMAGYGLIVLVFKENRYASRIVEVEKKQEVITTGPYALVRHPMYAGVLIMYTLSPLALGSYWAVLPALPLILVLVARIKDEEEVLTEKLAGYREYRQRLKYRLIPGLW
jgi:protein-S-isoprenylcysteine O-methyltransferase Ste14